jgi:iron complex outermembrane receptor protein
VLPALVNVQKSSVVGGELGIDWAAAPGLRFSASGDYIKATVDRFAGVNQLGSVSNFDNTAMPFTPKWQIVHMGDYRHGVGNLKA